jgi:hypothetical protein
LRNLYDIRNGRQRGKKQQQQQQQQQSRAHTRRPLAAPSLIIIRDSYIKKLFLDFGQGAKLDLLVIVELGFVGSSGIWGMVFL